jgi:hypothetical protein
MPRPSKKVSVTTRTLNRSSSSPTRRFIAEILNPTTSENVPLSRRSREFC